MSSVVGNWEAAAAAASATGRRASVGAHQRRLGTIQPGGRGAPESGYRSGSDPAAVHGHHRRGAGHREVAVATGELGEPVTAGLGGHRYLGDELVGTQGSGEEVSTHQVLHGQHPRSSRGDRGHRGAQGHQDRRVLRSRVVVRQASRQGPRLRIARWPTCPVAATRSGAWGAHVGGLFDGGLPGRGPDLQCASLGSDVVKVGNPVYVHDAGGSCQAEAHHRHQALASGQHLGVLVAAQQPDRVVDRFGSVIFESCGFPSLSHSICNSG